MLLTIKEAKAVKETIMYATIFDLKLPVATNIK
jgi:hypothetical protein